jgi:RHS repeat-associated protein
VLTTSTVGSVVTTYGTDVLGRRTSQRSSVSTATTSFGYDAMGHLTSFASPGASAAYLYGATGMREVKVVSQAGQTTTTSVLWAGGKPVVERDGDGTTLLYLYGPGGMPLSVQVTRSGTTSIYHYLTDAMGSVAALVSETGTVAATYSYDPWGVVTSVGGADAWLARRQPLRYRAYYLDGESGLYYLPARYYDPATARFLSPDPAAPSAGSPQSLNRYAYCEDDPVGASDPSGAVLDVDGNGRVNNWDASWEASQHAESKRDKASLVAKAVQQHDRPVKRIASWMFTANDWGWRANAIGAAGKAGLGSSHLAGDDRNPFLAAVLRSKPNATAYALEVAGGTCDALTLTTGPTLVGPPVFAAAGMVVDVVSFGYSVGQLFNGEATVTDALWSVVCLVPGVSAGTAGADAAVMGGEAITGRPSIFYSNSWR